MAVNLLIVVLVLGDLPKSLMYSGELEAEVPVLPEAKYAVEAPVPLRRRTANKY